jgi:hypothetical protein
METIDKQTKDTIQELKNIVTRNLKPSDIKIEFINIGSYDGKVNESDDIYIDLNINGYWKEDIEFSLKKFKQDLIEYESLDNFINYLKK